MNIGLLSIVASSGSRMKSILFFSVFLSAGLYLFCAAGTAADSSFPKEARFSEHIFGLRGLANVGRVAPKVYRGAQPLPEGYSTLKEMGIRTVINLRTTSSERRAVEAVGMKSVEVPMGVLKDVNPNTVNSIIDIIRNPENQPVFIHCRQGQDRTGVVVAAYRMKVDGWAFAEAEAEMQSFGFNDIWFELKEFIREYAKGLGK